MLKKTARILAALLVLLVIAAGGIMLYVNRDYEQPRYTVLKSDNDVELRQYNAQVVAEVYTDGAMDQKMNDAFRLLAAYIFGNNIAMTAPVTSAEAGQKIAQKIAMTSPVTGVQGDKGFVTRFVMPSAYTLKTLPKPKDDRVRLLNQPARKIVAYRFSGLMSDAKKDDALQKIKAFAAANKIKLASAAQVAYYDNPYTTLPWMRHNEVMVDVKGGGK